jgi:N-acetylmuramic acid 6-phosphate etherase
MLTTELPNPNSTQIDSLSPLQIAQLMNREDHGVAEAVGKELPQVATAIELITSRMRLGGRLLYIGAGTSGRLGVLDASECPPTFSTDPGLVVGIIAGGERALTTAIEGAEDDPSQAQLDLQHQHLSSKDVLVGIATSGRTPYVIGALKYARSLGAVTIGLVCNAESELAAHADVMITPVVGPEVISGSTRMKAGTATKLVLNMLSTGTMIQLGKTYGNLMVDLRATNSKLRSRSIRIVQSLTNLDAGQAEELLKQCGGEVKTAIVVQRCQLNPDAARERLRQNQGHLRLALMVLDS